MHDESWAITNLDKHSTSKVTAMESFLVPASSEGDEVTPRRTDTDGLHGLTLFLPDGMPVTIADEFLLSAHTNIADLAEAHCATNNHTLNHSKSPSPSQLTPRQATAFDMAPPTVQRPRRVKYKEATSSPVDPIHEQAQPDQPASEDMRPHMLISTPPSIPPDTIISARKDIPLPLSTEPSTLAKTAPSSDTSNSQPSDPHYSSPDIDSAVDMRYKHRRRHKQVPANEDQELVFQGRLPKTSNDATTISKRYDSANGKPASKASGEPERPALAAKSTNQTTSNTSGKPESKAKAHSGTAGQNSRKTEPVKKQPSPQSESKSPENSWDTEHPPLPGDARISGGSSNKRNNFTGRVRYDRKPKKPRESPWIKDSLIPKGDPKRHEQARWISSHKSSSSNSDRASSGWGTRRKRDDGGAALGDWSGGIAPASIDWDNRAPFKDHQTEVKIDNWVATVASALAGVNEVTFTEGANAFSFTGTFPHRRYVFPQQEQGDVVPRYWAPTHAEGLTIAVFWNKHISPDDKPRPFDDGDLDLVKPWWQRYVDKKSCMLQEYDHPWIAGNDPKETAEERLARKFDNGGINSVANHEAAEKAKKDAERKRKLARVAKAHKYSGVRTPSAALALPNGIKPGLNIFLRSATKADMVPVRDMYNRYIDNTFVVPETSRRSESDMLNRLKAARDVSLPFVVACQRGEVVKARNKKQNGGEDMIMSDRVVGFAYAVDWISEEQSIYRTTVQMEVFVDMDHYMKNIGSCLVDKMMGLLNPSDLERGGYDTVGEELDGVGPSKIVSNVMIRYSYDAQNTEKLAWVSEWLSRRLGFQKVADLQGVAQKFDRK